MYFGRYTDSQLQSAAQSLHSGLTAQAVTFPTPPITLLAFQGFIDAYKTASGAAIHGSKTDTTNKKDAKQDLINNMRSMVQYVNQVVNDTYESTPSSNYSSLQALVLSAGIKDLQFLKRPNPNGNTRIPVTINTKTGGNNILTVRVKGTKKYGSKNVKGYQMQYRHKVTPPTPINDWTLKIGSSRIEVIDVTAGIYEYRVAAIGGIKRDQTQVIWSDIQEVVVVGNIL